MHYLISTEELRAFALNRTEFNNIDDLTRNYGLYLHQLNDDIYLLRGELRYIEDRLKMPARLLGTPVTDALREQVRQRAGQEDLSWVSLLPEGKTMEDFVPLHRSLEVARQSVEHTGLSVVYTQTLPEERDTDTLYVVLGSALADAGVQKHRRNTWTPVTGRIAVFQNTRRKPSELGEKIREGGDVLAEYEPQSGVVHILLNPAFGLGMDRLVASLVQAALAVAPQPASPARVQRLRAALRARMTRGLLQDQEVNAQRASSALERHMRGMNAQVAMMTTDLREQEQARAALELARNGQNSRDEMGREYDRLMSIEAVERLIFEGRELVLYTKPLICTNPDTRTRHLIGRCKITLRFDDRHRMMTVQNLDRRLGSHDHPHVRNQNPCMGNLQEILPPLLTQGHLSAAVGAALGYLQTCNPQDAWGSGITSWPMID